MNVICHTHVWGVLAIIQDGRLGNPIWVHSVPLYESEELAAGHAKIIIKDGYTSVEGRKPYGPLVVAQHVQYFQAARIQVADDGRCWAFKEEPKS